ncbi:MAG: HAD family hydrolase [Candidatus Sericytochromatia bacterium]
MRPQALVFDLDDTLMDTYRQLVMQAHYQACRAMQQAGLNVSVDTLFATRLALLSSQPRAEINQLLAAHYDCQDEKVIQAGYETYFNPEIGILEPFAGVPEMLSELGQDYQLFLVTSGYSQTQQRKVEALGIGAHFREICYPAIHDPTGKYTAFAYLQQKYAYHPAEMVVIGDRITNEIVAGNRLGCPTIWIQQGECAQIEPQTPDEEPTLRAQHVQQVPALLQQLHTTSQEFLR